MLGQEGADMNAVTVVSTLAIGQMTYAVERYCTCTVLALYLYCTCSVLALYLHCTCTVFATFELSLIMGLWMYRVCSRGQMGRLMKENGMQEVGMAGECCK